MFIYRIIKDYAIITQYIGTSFKEELIIPSSFSFEGKNYPVQAIGKKVFSNLAFDRIHIPNTVKVISKEAFSFCHVLEGIVIPSSVELICDLAFAFSYIGSISFEENSKLRVLGSQTFYCSSIKDIKLPDSLEILGNCVFDSCYNLEELYIPKNVYKIGDALVNECTNLKTIAVDKDNKWYDSRNNCNGIIEKDRDVLIAATKNVSIPNDVKIIGKYSLLDIDGLKEITIPKSVEIIENSAFGCYDCLKLIIEGSFRLMFNNKSKYIEGPQIIVIIRGEWIT